MNEFEWMLRNMKIKKIMKNSRGSGRYYVFLDFDGVINVFCDETTEKYRIAAETGKFDFYDEGAMKRMSQFCIDYNADVIISSSWRYAGLEYCIQYLKESGMDERVRVSGMTSTEIKDRREFQITEYLLEHPLFENYIVFDDGYMPHISDHEVLTDPMKGWDEEADRKARAIMAVKY